MSVLSSLGRRDKPFLPLLATRRPFLSGIGLSDLRLDSSWIRRSLLYWELDAKDEL
jgi:hypothetical protein